MTEETHGAMIRIGDSVCFIDGIPDTCQHEYKDDVFITASGRVIHWHTFRQWASFCAPMRNYLIQQWCIDNDENIVEGTSECRKCGKIYHPGYF